MRSWICSRYFLFLFLLTALAACSTDLDFDQTKDLKLEPRFSANLVYFDIPAPEFVINGTEIVQVRDQSTVDIFNNTFFANDLVQTDLDFEINNTIFRAYVLEVQLLNAAGIPIDVITINVPAYAGVANSVTQKEVFSGTRLSILKRTTRIEIALRMAPGIPLTASSPGTLKMRSGLTAYFEVK